MAAPSDPLPPLLISMPPAVEAALDQLAEPLLPAPTVLYHYSSPVGLHAILTTGSIWATGIRFLNDSREFTHALDLVRERVVAAIMDPSEVSRSDLWRAAEAFLDRGHDSRAYVVSLSANGDLLSQWRGYCPPGAGFSIGFEVASFAAIVAKEDFILHPCFYHPDAHAALVTALMTDTRNAYDSWIASGGRPTQQAYERFGANFYVAFLLFAPMVKDWAFREEAEWRLVSAVVDPTDPRVAFRPGATTVVPYLPFPLAGARLVEVVIGPSPSQVTSELALQMLLPRANVPGGVPRRSSIPFRQV